MGKEIHLQPHTLHDPIVFEGIRGVNAIISESKIPGCITGGIAVQSYLPPEQHRKTVDLDFVVLCGGGSTGQFRTITNPLVDYLQSRGYDVNFKKKGYTYEFSLAKSNDALLIQHHRRTPSNYSRQRESLEREAENSHTYDKDGFQFQVLSPEDLILHKLSRTLIFSSKHGVKIPYSLTTDHLRKDADRIREDVVARLANVSPNEVAKLRLYYDCLDIKSLILSTDINTQYLESSASDWSREGMVTSGEVCQSFHQLAESL